MEPTGLITAEHPSYRTETAAFMFAISSQGGAFQKFIIVEANNRLAVHTIERLLGSAQSVSGTCRCMAVFRGVESVGTRDDMLEEVPYADFMLDIVSQDLLMDDPAIVAGFNSSLSDSEREYIQRKIEAEDIPPQPEVRASLSQGEPTGMTAEESRIAQALHGFGFKSQPVHQFVASVRHKIGSTDLNSLIREGCKVLTA